MKFDSNRAWLDAVAAVSANRQVLLPLAGVFFLLPTLLSTVFLADTQAQMMKALGKPELVERIVADNLGLLLGFGIGGGLVQGIGYLAVMAMLSDRGRPTVGEAIMVALRALPTLVIVFVLGMTGMFVATLALAGLLASMVALVAGVAAASVVAGGAVLVMAVYVSVKLSLVVPVVINEGTGNPVAAMVRSWRLTRRNSMRLLGFFALLTIGYVAIAFFATLVAVTPVALLAGEGQALTLVTGVVSGATGAVASVLLVAVMGQIHRQLAGPSPEGLARTFE